MDGNSLPNEHSKKCLVSILPFESIQSHSSGLYAPYKKTYPKFFTTSTTVHEWHESHDTPCHNVDCLSGRGLMMSEYGQNGDKLKRQKSKRRHA